MIYLIAYWIVSVIVESIVFYKAWKSFKKKNAYMVSAFKDAFDSTASGKQFKKQVTSPFAMFIGIIFFATSSPLIFMYTIFGWFKKLFGFQSELEKKAEEEKKRYTDAELAKEAVKDSGTSEHPVYVEHISPEDPLKKINDMNSNNNIIV